MKMMRKVVCMMALLTMVLTSISVDAEAAVKYKTYSNTRFTYTVKYPTKVTKISDYGTQEGAKFKSSDGKVSLVIWNSYGVSKSRNGKTVVANAKKNHKIKVAKNTKKEGSYSYTSGKNVTQYYHYFVSKGEIAFQITYPKSQKKYYTQAISGMIKSVKKNKGLVLKGN